MKFSNHHLAQLFSMRKAIVFCGAGVSLEPPASLPDWHSLRDSLTQIEYVIDRILFNRKRKTSSSVFLLATSCTVRCYFAVQ